MNFPNLPFLKTSKTLLAHRKVIICIVGLLIVAQAGMAQVILCEGDLGDNIFTDGDFGSGAANVVQMNPGLAPGFIYTTTVPPDDGEYTLTNTMNPWTNLFSSWLRIGDNDIDPQGYMMVVNASFTPGIFYEKIIDNLCENTVYQFSADVINLIRSNVTGHIRPNVSFLIDDVEEYTTGAIPQDEMWHTYGFLFATGIGQTSVKLALRNNAPGGTGNDLALDNIRFQACGPDSDVRIEPEGKICENSLFPTLYAEISVDTGFLQWQISVDNGSTWNDIVNATDRTHQIQQLNAGQYYFRYLYASNAPALANPRCRIVSREILVEIVPVTFVIRDTLCEGLIYTLNGEEYTETGEYRDTLTASNGCDSILILDLEFVPDPMIEAVFGFLPESCEGAADGSVFLISLSDLRPPYFFRVNDSIIPPPGTSMILAPGTYTVWIETPYGCFDKDEITVPAGPPLEVMTIPDTTIRLGHSVVLSSQTSIPIDSLYWTPASTLSCSLCPGPIAMPLTETTYTIHVSTDSGCEAEDEVTIRVDRTANIYVPNIFSPNQDQINDVLIIGLDPLIVTQIKEVRIWDRWGGVIAFSDNLMTNAETVIWDGNTETGPANPGAYVYQIVYQLIDGTEMTTSGDVTVMR